MIDQPPATPRKDALNEGAARAPAATPRASSTLGAAKGAFGDLRREKASISVEHGVTDRLAAGSLPGAADLARHAILADVNDPARGGVGEAWVRIPEATAWAPEGSPDYTVRVGGRAGGKRLLRLSDGQEPVAYADVSANARIAVLASLFEQALATPSPSRIRIEALRDEVRRVDKAEGGYGRARLLALLAGALTSLPER